MYTSEGKTIKLVTDDNCFNIIIGAVENAKNPESVFLQLSSWVYEGKGRRETRKTGKYFSRNAKKLEEGLYKFLKKNLHKILKDTSFDEKEFIVDSNIGENLANFTNKSKLTIEINLNLKKDKIKPLYSKKDKCLKPELLKVVSRMRRYKWLNNNNYFKFFNKKVAIEDYSKVFK